MQCCRILILFVIPLNITFAQITLDSVSSDSLEIRNDFNNAISTSREKKKLPLFYLKSLLSRTYFDINSENLLREYPIVTPRIDLSQFTKEELNSGLSHDQFVIYKKNKEELKKILVGYYRAHHYPWYDVFQKYTGILQQISAVIFGIIAQTKYKY